ncbi:MAG: hypothetical protein ACLP8A_17775 [Methylovirgula sp.]
MSNVLDTLKELTRLGIYLALLVVLAINLPALSGALGQLIDKVANVSSFKFAGVELGFDESSVIEKLAATDLSTAAKSQVYKLVLRLDPEQFERLIYVGDLVNLCEFENPTAEMRQQVASDYLLRENGLTAITKSTELRDQVRHTIEASEKTSGKPSDIGYPLSCYYMTLTDTGRNVKTVLVKTFGQAFATKLNFKPNPKPKTR